MALTSGQMLINELDDLRRLLETFYKQVSDSGVERTAHFLAFSGTDCRYYTKSMDLFLSEDYEKLRDSVRQLSETIDIIEGKRG